MCWAIRQQNWKTRTRVSRDTQPTRMQARRPRQPEQTGHWKLHRICNNTSENSMQTRGQNWMASWRTSTKLTTRNFYDPLHTLPGDWRGRNAPRVFLWATVTPVSKPHKDTTKKENLQNKVLYEHTCKTCNKILANRIQQHTKRITPHDQLGFIPGSQG